MSFEKNFYRLRCAQGNLSFAPRWERRAGFENSRDRSVPLYCIPQENCSDLTRSQDDEALVAKRQQYREQDALVKDCVAYRGDSRFPWQVWRAGGLWAKGKGSGHYDVQLHQVSPGSGQDVVSMSENPDVGIRYGMAYGLCEQRYFPGLEPYAHIDQRDKTWTDKHGYSYVAHVPEGVCLRKANRDASARGYFAQKQRQYRWEEEVAVLGGVSNRAILAIRELHEAENAELTDPAVYTETAFISRALLNGRAHHIPEQQVVLDDVVTDLLGVHPERSADVVAGLRQIIASSAATAIARWWRKRASTTLREAGARPSLLRRCMRLVKRRSEPMLSRLGFLLAVVPRRSRSTGSLSNHRDLAGVRR